MHCEEYAQLFGRIDCPKDGRRSGNRATPDALRSVLQLHHALEAFHVASISQRPLQVNAVVAVAAYDDHTRYSLHSTEDEAFIDGMFYLMEAGLLSFEVSCTAGCFPSIPSG